MNAWAACVANLPGVFDVVGPACPNSKGKLVDWHVTLYGRYSPDDQSKAQAEADAIIGGKAGQLQPYLVKNPADQGNPKGSNSAAYVWTPI